MSDPIFHLRRIGPKATKPDVVDLMDFHKVTSIIGRNVDRVDFLLDSINHIQRLCLSRCHARIVRQSPGNQHRLHDDSLNGVFVNNLKIAGSCVLREGDRVTFGHPSGQKLSPGSRARQPDSEYQFLFEKCNCTSEKEEVAPDTENSTKTKQVDTDFKVPTTIKSPPTLQKKRGRIPTQTFTQDDVKQLKQSWQKMDEAKSWEPEVKANDPTPSNNEPGPEIPDGVGDTEEMAPPSKTDLKTSAVVNGDASEHGEAMDTSEAKVEPCHSDDKKENGDEREKETSATSEHATKMKSAIDKSVTKCEPSVNGNASNEEVDAKAKDNAEIKSANDKSEMRVESLVSAGENKQDTGAISEHNTKMKLAVDKTETIVETSVNSDENKNEPEPSFKQEHIVESSVTGEESSKEQEPSSEPEHIVESSVSEEKNDNETSEPERMTESSVSEEKNDKQTSEPEPMEAQDSRDNLEETCEALMQDLATIRSMVESPVGSGEAYTTEPGSCTCIKSPTKDASIQTSQVPGFTVALTVSTLSAERVDTVKATVTTVDDNVCDQLSIEHSTEESIMEVSNDTERVDTVKATVTTFDGNICDQPSIEHTTEDAIMAETETNVEKRVDTFKATVTTVDDNVCENTTEDPMMEETHDTEKVDTVKATVTTVDDKVCDQLSIEHTTEKDTIMTETDSSKRLDTVEDSVNTTDSATCDHLPSSEQNAEDASMTKATPAESVDADNSTTATTDSATDEAPAHQPSAENATEDASMTEDDSAERVDTVKAKVIADDSATSDHTHSEHTTDDAGMEDTDSAERTDIVKATVIADDPATDEALCDQLTAKHTTEDTSMAETDPAEGVDSVKTTDEVLDVEPSTEQAIEDASMAEADCADGVDTGQATVVTADSATDDEADDQLSIEQPIEDASIVAADVTARVDTVTETVITDSHASVEKSDRLEDSPKPQDEKTTKSAVEHVQDTDSEHGDFECELMPKEPIDVEVEDVSDDLPSLEYNGEQSEKSSYMVSDSIDYDYEDDEPDVESNSVAEEEMGDDENGSEPGSKEVEEDDVSDTDTTDYMNKIEEEQDHEDWSDEESAEIETEEINKCQDDEDKSKPNFETLSEGTKEKSSNEDESGRDSCDRNIESGNVNDSSKVEQEESGDEEVMEVESSKATVEKDGPEAPADEFLKKTDPVVTSDVQDNLVEERQEILSSGFDTENKTETTIKTETSPQIENSKESDNDDFECELLPKESKTDDIEGASEDLNKAEDMGEQDDKSAVMLSDSIDYDFDDDFDEDPVDTKSEPAEEEDTYDETGAAETEEFDNVNEVSKVEQQKNEDDEVMEVECVGGRMVQDRNANEDHPDNCLDETGHTVTSNGVQDNLVGEKPDIENVILLNENEVSIEKVEQDIVLVESDEEVGTEDTIEIIEERNIPVVHKTPEKFKLNTSVVLSSQLSSPLLESGIENFTNDVQSPIIARQEQCYTEGATPVTDDEADDVGVEHDGDKEDPEDEDPAEEEEEGNNSDDQLSCNFSDYDDDGYSPPGLGFSDMEDSNEDYNDFENEEEQEEEEEEEEEEIEDEDVDDDDDDVSRDSETEEVKMPKYAAKVNAGPAGISHSGGIENVTDLSHEEVITEEPLEEIVTEEIPDETNNVEIFPEEIPDEINHVEDMTDETDEINQYNQTKPPVKRKCDFGDVDSPKKYKSSDEETTPTFTFKTPNSKLKLKRSMISTPKATMETDQLQEEMRDPDEITGTQMMNSDQSLDMSSLTATQMDAVEESLEKKTVDDGTRSKPTRSKAADLLARLRAKKQQRQGQQVTVKMEVEEDPVPGTSRETTLDQEVGEDAGDRRTAAEVTLEQLDSHVNRCREVLGHLKRSFDAQVQLKGNPRVVAWKQELLNIEKKLEFPKTVIAVVGDTGAGKSSLMNAILDHRSVLPTSGMRACTAVVVEVVENTTSNYFEADIEFLQKKEWLTELQVLLRDLTSFDGTVKNRPPDPASDAFVSYCKVRAVYGRIDTYETLSRINVVTHWLGKTKVIKSSKPEELRRQVERYIETQDPGTGGQYWPKHVRLRMPRCDPEEFRRQVERYIETQDPGTGGQYWPIVKHVRLRMPRCDVCSSGAALVDLPGVRDSNAARDKIAREYLKNCTAVWVVSSIHRAIDDKTARDLLGETFRRQLLMDGQYGSIAFICTKTDVIIPSEIIRPLKLEDRTRDLETKVSKLEDKKADLQLTVARCSRQLSDTRASVDTLRQEIVELEDNLTEIRALLDAENNDGEQGEEGETENTSSELADEHEALQEYQEEVRHKQEEIETHRGTIEQLAEQKQQAKQQIHELETELNVYRREITAICAKARNEYSKKEIRRDFKAGLKEMKRRAGMTNEDDEEEEDDDDDDDDDDIGSTADNLKVFCCSSTEYQKLKNLLTDDGPAQVFSSLEDTEVPVLRRYVHEMTSVRRQQSFERLVRGLGRFVFDLLSYTTTGSCSSSDRLGTKSVVDGQVRELDAALVPVLKQLQSDIDVVFDGSIRPKMEEGAGNASSEANNTVTKWGAPVNRDKTQDRRTGGLHFSTYRATTRRQGVYSSPTFGPIDMNEELAEPMYRSMTMVWDKTFSGLLWRVLDKLKAEMLARLRACVEVVCQQLEQLGVPRDRLGRVGAQLQVSAANKLTEMVNHLKDLITDRQRNISRVVTPTVQERLTPTYDMCASESGTGMYMRMKTYMGNGVERERCSMFDEATNKLMTALMELQTEILAYVQGVCQALMGDLRVAFEPLWDTPVNSSLLRSAFTKPVKEACSGVREIYRLAGLENTEEKTLAQQTKGSNSTTPGLGGVASLVAQPGTSGVGTLYCRTPGVIKQENKNESTKTTTLGVGTQLLPVKSEPGPSYTITQLPGIGGGKPTIQVKQEVKGATRNCTVGSGALQYTIQPSATSLQSLPGNHDFASARPPVSILPRPSPSAAGQTFTHNAPATGSAATVPPGAGSVSRQITLTSPLLAGAAVTARQITPSAAPAPVYNMIKCSNGVLVKVEKATPGGIVTQTSVQSSTPNVISQKPLTGGELVKNYCEQLLASIPTSKSSQGSPTQGKENARKRIQQGSAKRGVAAEKKTVSKIKKEPADTGYERNRKRPKFLGTIDLTDD